ncbi:MAG: YraN family protein [candidate division WOR-3 bacterium]
MANQLGQTGEKVARNYLKKQGYKILEKNFRCSIGEIDIIAQDKSTIVFIEVKTRRSNLIQPFESVGFKKQEKLRSLAEYYLQEKDYLDKEVRFDILSIIYNNQGQQIEHLKDAF